jgi:hypothetical protein
VVLVVVVQLAVIAAAAVEAARQLPSSTRSGETSETSDYPYECMSASCMSYFGAELTFARFDPSSS